MKNMLEDYKIYLKNIPIKCHNTCVICLTKNLIQHFRTKHIDSRHHFIWDHVINNNVILEFIDTKNQLADIFTKALNEDQFDFIRRELSMLNCRCEWAWLYIFFEIFYPLFGFRGFDFFLFDFEWHLKEWFRTLSYLESNTFENKKGGINHF